MKKLSRIQIQIKTKTLKLKMKSAVFDGEFLPLLLSLGIYKEKSLDKCCPTLKVKFA